MKKALICTLLCYCLAVSCNLASSSLYPPAIEEDIHTVLPLSIMQFLCLDHRGFAADLLFSKVIIHSGSLIWKPASIQFDRQWSFAVMNLVTDLDPGYFSAYLFTGMGLIRNDTDVLLARPVLEKGMTALPDRWEIPFWLGYDFYIYREEFQTAAEYFTKMAAIADSPGGYRSFLLSAAKKTGNYQLAYSAMRYLYDHESSIPLQNVYAKKLTQLNNLIVLERDVALYRQEYGEAPRTLADLIARGIITAIPPDPFNQPYFYDYQSNKVVLHKKSKL